MAKQDYRHHIRYYIPHHFVFYPIVTVLLMICLKQYVKLKDPVWLMMAALTFMLGALSFMLRQHYALTNQNRIVRLEMRLRYYQLSQQVFDPIEKQLSFGQIAALRFEGDHELLALIDRTVKEQLTPNVIKQQVTDWQADHMRA